MVPPVDICLISGAVVDDATPGNADEPKNAVGVLERIGEREIGSPRVAAYHPVLDSVVLPDGLEVPDSSCYVVGVRRARTTATARLKADDVSEVVEHGGDRGEVVAAAWTAVTEQHRYTRTLSSSPESLAITLYKRLGHVPV